MSVDRKDSNRLELPEIKEKFTSKKILEDKTNCANTIKRFYNEDEEKVKNLNFFDPDVFTMENKDVIRSTCYGLFNINNSTSKVKAKKNLKTQSNIAVNNNNNPNANQDKNDATTSRMNTLPAVSSSIEERGIGRINDKNINRIENQNTENLLENKRKAVQERINEMKSERAKAINQMLILQKDIENNSAEIEVLENFSKFTDGVLPRKHELIKNAKRAGIEGKEILSNVALQYQQEINKRERDLLNLRNDIENKKEAKEKLKIRIEEIKNNLEPVKTELKSIKNKLMLHYHKILNEGLDTRTEGLIWVIKAIWNLGHNVIMYYMPSYLDEKAIDCLFSIAHKEFALQKIRADIEDTKSKLKNRLNVVKRSHSKGKCFNNTFKTEMQPAEETKNEDVGFGKVFIKKFQAENAFNQEKYNMNKIEEMLIKKQTIDEEVLSLMSKISELEKVYEMCKAEIQTQKKRELNRISKEYLTNDYQRRYNVPQETVISAICGEDNMNTEFSRLIREQKMYYEEINKCKNFNIYQNNKRGFAKVNSSGKNLNLPKFN